MKTYKSINIYTEEDFEPNITIHEAQQALESKQVREPCLILFGKRMGGVNIKVGEHTREVADIMSAVYELDAKNDADASGTSQ